MLLASWIVVTAFASPISIFSSIFQFDSKVICSNGKFDINIPAYSSSVVFLTTPDKIQNSLI